MCYCGCPYEVGYGENVGGCTIKVGEKPMLDAICVVHDKMLEQSEFLEDLDEENLPLLINEDWMTDYLRESYLKRLKN